MLLKSTRKLNEINLYFFQYSWSSLGNLFSGTPVQATWLNLTQNWGLIEPILVDSVFWNWELEICTNLRLYTGVTSILHCKKQRDNFEFEKNLSFSPKLGMFFSQNEHFFLSKWAFFSQIGDLREKRCSFWEGTFLILEKRTDFFSPFFPV